MLEKFKYTHYGEDDDDDKPVDAKLIEAEERSHGGLSFKVLRYYVRYSGGVCWISLFVFLSILSQGATAGSTYWLSYWISNENAHSRNFFIIVLCALGAAHSLFLLLTTIVRAFIFNRGSVRLHTNLIRSLVAAPIMWFNMTPLGRIINRFSRGMKLNMFET